MTNEDGLTIEQPVKRGPGRPKKAPVAAARTQTETPKRQLGRGEYLGRNGQILTRRGGGAGIDQLELPEHLKEPGWSYQWQSERVRGDPDLPRAHNNFFHNKGWRPVLAVGRWNGVFGPKSETGHIVVGEAGLYERPAQMTEDAQEEDRQLARRQMADRDALTRGQFQRNIPQGFASRSRGDRSTVVYDVAEGADAPRPSYQTPEPGE